MTNPNNAIGTNAAYGTRTSVNAFNDFAQLVNGRGVLSGFAVVPKSGMTLEVGGIAGTRDVAVAEDNLGNRTLVDNRLGTPVDVTIGAASVSQNRYDAIVVYVNNPAQADDTTPDAPSACGIIVVQGGSTGVSENQIRTAITADGGTGSIAYYTVLATVLVPAGATTITSGNITQSHIAISASDIADGEITGAMLADGAVSTAKLAGTAVTTAKIADNAITLGKLATDLTKYSTTKKQVGTWIDGRPVYRAVVTGTTLAAANEVIDATSQVGTGFDEVINVYGCLKASDGRVQPIQRVCADANVAQYSIGVGDFRVENGYMLFLLQHPVAEYQGQPYSIVIEFIETV